MKKIWKICFVLTLGLVLTACTEQTVQRTVYDIAVVPAVWSEELDDQLQAYVEDRPQLNVYQDASETEDGLYQALLVEDLTAQEVDAICLEPVDEALVQPKIDAARQAGVVVVVGNDFYAMVDQAQLLLEK